MSTPPSASTPGGAPSPLPNFPKPDSAFGWFKIFREQFPQWYCESPRTVIHPKPWASGFDPATDPVFAHNEMLLPGIAPRAVFAVLVNATQWPLFYPNADEVQLPPDDCLEAGMAFQWKTFATTQKSTVELFEQDSALGWTAESFGVKAFHRWILVPQDHGTLVITEECQNGVGAWLVKGEMNPSLHATHQLWLEQLKLIVTAS